MTLLYGEWCNGSTNGFGPFSLGSTPDSPAKGVIMLEKIKKILDILEKIDTYDPIYHETCEKLYKERNKHVR